MKKTITTILSLLMVLTMIFGFTGCGKEKSSKSGEGKVKLSAKTISGLSIEIPDDFTEFKETENVMLSTNEKSTASIAISGKLDMRGILPEDVTQEYYIKTVLSDYANVKILEFKTDATVSSAPAVYVHFATKNASGIEIESYAYLIYLHVDDGDGMMQSVMFAFTKESSNSLKTNIDSIKSSLKLNQD